MTLAARIAPLLPDRLVAAVARAVYPRFEPELARLPELCPDGCGTAVDVGGWYGPWTRRLAGRADRVVTVEPVPRLARLLAATTPPNVRVVQPRRPNAPAPPGSGCPRTTRANAGCPRWSAGTSISGRCPSAASPSTNSA